MTNRFRWFARVARIAAGIVALVAISTCNDQPTTPEIPESPPSTTAPGFALEETESVVLVGAGNIARCDRQNDEQTALLLDAIQGTVFTTGDNILTGAALADYQNCYGSSWGRHRARTRPAAGEDDYRTSGAAGYFAYFGAAAGEPGQGYYSYDLGAWHIVVLNSGIATGANSAQVAWLKNDLAMTSKPCVLAIWDNPRFSSTGTAVRSGAKPMWDALYAARADVIVNGHYRVYERFAPQTPTGAADPALGIRQFTIGTGGHATGSFGSIRPNSEARAATVFGVLKLTLNANSYAWQFVPVQGQTFTDTGSRDCYGRPAPPPNQAPTANAGGPYNSEAAVTFDGSASSDPDNNGPLTYAWTFHDGSTATGATVQKTYETDGSYTATLVVTDARGLASAPATAAVTIANVPPTVSAGSDATVALGTAFSLSATFTDPGGTSDAPWAWTIQWGDAAPHEAGATSALGGPISRSHTYAAPGQYTVRVTVTDKDGGQASDVAIVNVSDPSSGVVLVGAGDIASCDPWDGDEATAKLLDAIPGIVFTVGDNAYINATASDFANCYEPTWGRHKARTKAVAGNHDYGTPNASAYFNYFGASAGDPTKGYYSFEAGDWLVIVMNHGLGSDQRSASSPQIQWMRAQLAAWTKPCALVIGHYAQFTSTAGRWDFMWNLNPMWDAMYEYGVDLNVAAHDHVYERFKKMRTNGTLDPQYGIRQITVGTGGYFLYDWSGTHPNSETRNNTAYGVLKLTLRPTSYEWEFVPEAGKTYTDRGTESCHGRPGGEPPPNQAPTANAGGPYQGDQSVTLAGTGSDPDGNVPVSYRWTFHDNSTATGAGVQKTYATDGSYTATLVVTDALGLESAPSMATIVIANVAPTVNAGPNVTRQAGSAYSLSATFTDPGGTSDSPWSWSIDWGDGSAPASGSTSTVGGPVGTSHTYATAGQYTARVTVTDKDGGVGVDDAVVTITEPTPNQAPVANHGGPYTADNTVTFTGSGSDPDGHLPLTYRWTFSDGSSAMTATTTKTYAIDGSYSATLTVTDAEGLASAPATTTVTIANVAPTTTAGSDASVQLGNAFALSATFTDPGGTLDAPWNWTLDWGDAASENGSTSALGGPIARSHTFAAVGQYTVRVTVTDKDGGSHEDALVVTVTEPSATETLVGAGNIARCDSSNDDGTALLLNGVEGTVFTTGDNIYGGGALSDYQNCYNPNWGQHRARTRPSPGETDYATSGASGYFQYFGSAAGAAGSGYYSYDLGAWHIVVLNSNISMAAGSAQEQWLRNDLTANTKRCILAYWHHPRFSSYSTSVRSEVKPLWDALYAFGADVVLNGHYRLYERFNLQSPTEAADPNGMRQFTVGTGGQGVNTFGTPRPNSQVRLSGSFGVLKLTLEATRYSWAFMTATGQTLDSGTTDCH